MRTSSVTGDATLPAGSSRIAHRVDAAMGAIILT